MARTNDGELYLEIEGASAEQLRRGLLAARRRLALTGVDLEAAFAAQAKMDEALLAELGSEQGAGEEPASASDDDLDLATAVEDAWMAAIGAAGFDMREQPVRGDFGLIERAAEEPPVLRDLFESVT